MEHDDFLRLMETVAQSWNRGDTLAALSCFTEDAVYMEPPDSQRYEGRDALFEFFGGEDPPPMWMEWHHLVVDGDTGVGEYTYRGNRQYHGLVIVQLRDGVIARWREYQVESELRWDRFVGPSRFA
ncbi:MAG: nuclear transport factor 2 family protein [Actinomycetota bacterium]